MNSSKVSKHASWAGVTKNMARGRRMTGSAKLLLALVGPLNPIQHCPSTAPDINRPKAVSHVSCISENDYNQAIDFYTRAIELETDAKKLAVLYANRSFAHLKVESFGYSLTDAQAAIKNDASYIKGKSNRPPRET